MVAFKKILRKRRRDELVFDVVPGLARIKREMYSLKTGKAAPRPSLRFLSWRWVLVPSCAVIVVALTVLFLSNTLRRLDPGHRIRCMFSHGEMNLKRGDDAVRIGRNDVLASGEEIEIGRGAVSEFAFADRVVFRLKGYARLRIIRLELSGDNRLLFDVALDRGMILFDFKKLSGGGKAVVRTPNSIAGVTGTSFGVYVDEKQNVSYEVLRGEIRVRNRIPGDLCEPDLLREIEDALDRDAVPVRERQVCVISAREYNSFKQSLAQMIQHRRNTNGRFDVALVKDLVKRPSVKTASGVNSVMIAELQEFSEKVSRGEDAGSGKVLTIAAPKGAKIYVDGKYRGTGSITLLTERGIHSVEVKAKGYREKRLDVSLNVNRDIAVKLQKVQKIPDLNKWLSEKGIRHISIFPGDNILCIGRKGFVSAISGNVLLWEYELNADSISSPLIDGGRIYLVSGGSRLIALSLAEGKILWSKTIEGTLSPGTELTAHDRKLYVSTSNGYIHCFTTEGRLEWKIGLSAGIMTTPVILDQYVFVGAVDGNLYGVDSVMKAVFFKVRVGWASSSAIHISDRKLFVSTMSGEIVCYDHRRDEIVWSYKTGSGVPAHSEIDEQNLYLFYKNGSFYKLDLKGNLIWEKALGNKITRRPLVDNINIYIVSNRMVYTIDKDTGSIKWSYAIPSSVSTNIALSRKNIHIGTEGGIVTFKRQ